MQRRSAELGAQGVPEALAQRVAEFTEVFSSFDIIEVASATSIPVDTVAAVYFALGAELELQWLRDQVVALPRENRWQALARVALRDDLYSLESALARDVLEIPSSSPEPEVRIQAWIKGNVLSVSRGARCSRTSRRRALSTSRCCRWRWERSADSAAPERAIRRGRRQTSPPGSPEPSRRRRAASGKAHGSRRRSEGLPAWRGDACLGRPHSDDGQLPAHAGAAMHAWDALRAAGVPGTGLEDRTSRRSRSACRLEPVSKLDFTAFHLCDESQTPSSEAPERGIPTMKTGPSPGQPAPARRAKSAASKDALMFVK